MILKEVYKLIISGTFFWNIEKKNIFTHLHISMQKPQQKEAHNGSYILIPKENIIF